ncbi:unnamed protein product [Haemonchus placei]|uniref:Uncharacterized protein n=1 Tax=Haemonchus placei TaxID=6290 RepID=A0A0N4W875_HAEPC|nr:unnamed protein product [Haemonchus placei]
MTLGESVGLLRNSKGRCFCETAGATMMPSGVSTEPSDSSVEYVASVSRIQHCSMTSDAGGIIVVVAAWTGIALAGVPAVLGLPEVDETMGMISFPMINNRSW